MFDVNIVVHEKNERLFDAPDLVYDLLRRTPCLGVPEVSLQRAELTLKVTSAAASLSRPVSSASRKIDRSAQALSDGRVGGDRHAVMAAAESSSTEGQSFSASPPRRFGVLARLVRH